MSERQRQITTSKFPAEGVREGGEGEGGVIEGGEQEREGRERGEEVRVNWEVSQSTKLTYI